MITRRSLIAAAAALTLTTSAAGAQEWKKQYPELTFAVIPAENASATTDIYTPFAEYLSKEIGVPVKLRIANDYAAVIEAQRTGSAQIAFYGPASYARAVITGVKIDPLVVQRHNTGLTGYYSVIWVRADSPYKELKDLKGKTIALVDPNSTSGNQAPRYFLNKEGASVDSFFGKSVYAGSHDNAVLAVAQGTADAAANAWNSETDNYLIRLMNRGLLKTADGKPLTEKDFRIVFKSDFLPEGPFAVLDSLPADLKAKIKQAFLDAPKKDKAAFDKLSGGKDIEFAPISAKDYDGIIGMVKYNDDQRKRS
ncbi:phosphonate-binding periplasmic protein [Azorhizobium caulinodans ORS 571]|uniref:Phosphonate-binding periplasmic protein n=1 Tax=Azorhizobium caulinodans (strain ATCC 43989 / DSM 5975 / JCM 20966 / LMG 6465 / NBRC 14845 / NCIMB 13405 / ORS 571) TaxID=438753 RepID=A8HQR9_AZOC5|nr:phosphonate ABC transporter substrate-binding protein [Azorhizobium caulinodans]BAF87055.1 phosphonate-binding periplasmic protein [Azorhizobium caulinodans ORS 571]